MKTNIHHVAITVSEFDQYAELFKQVFEMQVEKKSGQKPNRKIWFRQGIQLNECSSPSPLFDHIGISAGNQEELLTRAQKYGCTPLPEGSNWFALPNGIRVELKDSI